MRTTVTWATAIVCGAAALLCLTAPAGADSAPDHPCSEAPGKIGKQARIDNEAVNRTYNCVYSLLIQASNLDESKELAAWKDCANFNQSQNALNHFAAGYESTVKSYQAEMHGIRSTHPNYYRDEADKFSARAAKEDGKSKTRDADTAEKLNKVAVRIGSTALQADGYYAQVAGMAQAIRSADCTQWKTHYSQSQTELNKFRGQVTNLQSQLQSVDPSFF